MNWQNILKNYTGPEHRMLDDENIDYDPKDDYDPHMQDLSEEQEYIMISEASGNYNNQKEIIVYWGYGDGGEGETIATFTDKDLDDIYDWIEHWAKENGHSDKEIHQE